MTIMLTIYTLPSIIALILKLLIALKINYGNLTKNKPALLFFISLFALNFCELAGFLFFTAGTQDALWGLKLYCSSLVAVTASLLTLSANMAGLSSKIFQNIVTCTVVFIVIMLFSPLLIIDTQSTGYSITRVPGKAYHLFTVFIFLSALAGIGLLSFGAKKLNNLAASRCKVVLISTVPFVITLIATMSLMAFDINISIACFVSLATTVMLVTLIYTESKHHLFLINSHLPWTQEYQYKRAIRALGDQIHHQLYLDDINLKQYQKQLETIAIAMAHSYSPSTTQANIAKRLDLSPTTLARKMKDEN